ncbi:MAG: hypothetical protein EA398_17595 [Deltaproteobacteria bacterium]|nr:MAG: hypothetical protein EA398_17595 [Deltaproteobacteria bacterium]
MDPGRTAFGYVVLQWHVQHRSEPARILGHRLVDMAGAEMNEIPVHVAESDLKHGGRTLRTVRVQIPGFEPMARQIIDRSPAEQNAVHPAAELLDALRIGLERLQIPPLRMSCARQHQTLRRPESAHGPPQ